MGLNFVFNIVDCIVGFGVGVAAVFIWRWLSDDHEGNSDVLFFPDPKMPCFSVYWELEGQKNSKCRKANCEYAHNKPGELTSLIRLFQTLDKARKTIDLCIFDFTLQHLADFLIKASAARIRVRIITDAHLDRQQGGDQGLGDQIPNLQEAGIEVRVIKSGDFAGLMHNKFVVLDGTRLLMGSFNWTRSAVLRNHESIIKTSERRIVRKFHMKFQELWAKSKKKPASRASSRVRSVVVVKS